MTPEGAVVKAVLKYLSAIGIYAWRNQTGAVRSRRPNGTETFIRFGLVGSADILGIMPDGRFLAIECKAGRNKPTAEQLEFLAAIDFRGGVSGVARSIEDVQKIIKGAA